MTKNPTKKGQGAVAVAPTGPAQGADDGVKQPDTAGADLATTGGQTVSQPAPAGADGVGAPGGASLLPPAAAAAPVSNQKSGDDQAGAGELDVDQPLDAVAPRYIYGIEISATRDGFRRAGRAWYREPTFIQEGDLDEDQIAALLAEPNIRMVGARREAPVEGDQQ